MSDSIKVVLAGIGGYGKMYLRHLLSAPAPRGFQIVGVADPAPSRCEQLASVVREGIPVYSSLESFYDTQSADLAVIATPVHMHSAHIQLALEHGSHVLCEKPLASSMDDVRKLLKARDEAKRHVSIGYQWSYSEPIRALKRDISAGILGKPQRMRTLVLWPRGQHYYQRNTWAGRVSDNNGAPVLDSPLHNACAHFVHNVFYVLSRDNNGHAAFPSEITAELYRANDIENYDTATVRCTIGKDVEAIIVASHAVPQRRGPVFCYEFEDATVSYDDSCDGMGMIARFKNGQIKQYGRPCTSDDPTKLWHAIDCARTGNAPICGIEASAGQTALVCAAQQSAYSIGAFADDAVISEDGPNGPLRWVRGLEDDLRVCYDAMSLPSELGFAWGKAGRRVVLDSPDVALGRHSSSNGKSHTKPEPKVTTTVYATNLQSPSQHPAAGA